MSTTVWAETVGMVVPLDDRDAQERDPIEADLARQVCRAIDRGDLEAVQLLTDAADLLSMVRAQAQYSVKVN